MSRKYKPPKRPEPILKPLKRDPRDCLLFRFLKGDWTAHPQQLMYYTPKWIYTEAIDEWLEGTHDWIQWCFPTSRQSEFVPWSPVLDPRLIPYIKADLDVMHDLTMLRERMIDFYRDNTQWLQYSDHNHARISRIMQSTQLLFGPEETKFFYDAILGMMMEYPPSTINLSTRTYWRSIVRG